MPFTTVIETTEPSSLFTPQDEVNALAWRVMEQELQADPTGMDLAVARELVSWLMEIRHGLRLYYLNELVLQEQLWDRLRQSKDSQLLDLVLRLTIRFRLHLGESEYRQYATHMAYAYTELAQVPEKNPRYKLAEKPPITDPEFQEKLSSREYLITTFYSEAWLVYLLTLERSLHLRDEVVGLWRAVDA